MLSLYHFCFSKFYQTVKKRVDDYFKSAKIVRSCAHHHCSTHYINYFTFSGSQDPKFDYWMFLRYAVFLLSATSCWLGGVSYFNHSQWSQCNYVPYGCRLCFRAVCLLFLHLVLDGDFFLQWLLCHVPMMQGKAGCMYSLHMYVHLLKFGFV